MTTVAIFSEGYFDRTIDRAAWRIARRHACSVRRRALNDNSHPLGCA